MDRRFESQLTPKQVARAIGVSEASLKRWSDQGLIQATRTCGGHRRIECAEVVRFLRQTGRPLVRPEVLGLPCLAGAGEACIQKAVDHMGAALIQGDEAQLGRVVFNLLLANHSTTDILDRVMARSLHAIGDAWASGRVEVYQERLACELCMHLLRQLVGVVGSRNQTMPYALGGSLEGDPYTIPSAMVEVVLREQGWRAESHGVGLPAESLCKAILEKRPKLVWVSVAAINDAERFIRQWVGIQESAHCVGASIVVGGRALAEPIRKQMVYSAYCDTMGHLAGFLKTIKEAAAPSPSAV